MLTLAIQAMALRKTNATGDFDTHLLEVNEVDFIGKTVPDVNVVTQAGSTILSTLVDNKPSLLLLSYYTCGHVCPTTIANLHQIAAHQQIDLPDDEFNVIVLSFDEKDNLMTMAHVQSSLDTIPANWTFGLLKNGESERLTQAVGFNFFFSEKDQMFIHPAALIFLSPEGEVMRYLFTTEPDGGDVALALIESRNRAPRINEIIDMVKLTCFQFDRSRSRYSLHPTILFGATGLGLLGLVALIVLMTGNKKHQPGGN